MSWADEVALRRGLLVTALHEQYPMALAHRSLVGRLELAYAAVESPAKEMAADLEYLRAKGLVERADEPLAGRKVMAWRLRPDGVDVAMGHSAIAGIQMRVSE